MREGIFFDTKSLLTWFLENKRSFPWRLSPTPYRVWISEVMLQQTRANVVIPYFERWMERFPDVRALATAEYSAVLKAWEGLGYYRRARYLHLGAKQIVDEFGGVFPSTQEELSQIKGLGPYTIGAILSFAFGQKVPCVDGNVLRVLSRYYNSAEDISLGKTQKKLRDTAEGILKLAPDASCSEALIELGALVCQKKAACSECPLKESCGARRENRQHELPIKGKKTVYIDLCRVALILEHEGKYLLSKGKEGEVMEDLYEFPYFEAEEEISLQEVKKKAAILCGKGCSFRKKLSLVKHSFTRFRVVLHPFHFEISSKKEVAGLGWFTKEEMEKLTFSSGHRRIFEQFFRGMVS